VVSITLPSDRLPQAAGLCGGTAVRQPCRIQVEELICISAVTMATQSTAGGTQASSKGQMSREEEKGGHSSMFEASAQSCIYCSMNHLDALCRRRTLCGIPHELPRRRNRQEQVHRPAGEPLMLWHRPSRFQAVSAPHVSLSLYPCSSAPHGAPAAALLYSDSKQQQLYSMSWKHSYIRLLPIQSSIL